MYEIEIGLHAQHMLVILSSKVNMIGVNLYDYLMSKAIFALVINKTLIQAPKIMKKMTMGTHWICQSSQINGDTQVEVVSGIG